MKILAALFFIASLSAAAETVTVGSKNFTESYVLGEWLSQILETEGHVHVERRFGIGGTGMVFKALQSGEIDLYIEYTGTIKEAILKKTARLSHKELLGLLKPLGLVMTQSLGFNNTYALAVRKNLSAKYNLQTISDLRPYADHLRFAFSYEFMSRSDGFEAMKNHYQLPIKNNFSRMEHSLVYEAIQNNQVDVVEIYSTDAKIEKSGLTILEDDLKFFPDYQAVILASSSFVEAHPRLWQMLQRYEGTLSEPIMRYLNAGVDIEKKSFGEVVGNYLQTQLRAPARQDWLSRVLDRTKEHIFLVGIALLFSISIGVPLGLLALRSRILGQTILLASGLMQTLPSLALLCFLIPLLGIGNFPALVALILYGLLPIVVNIYEGFKNLDPSCLESAKSLSLTKWQRFKLIELPLALSNILAGIRTSTIITIGTATLAALIGGGGYGAPIVTGLALNDTATILEGAIPAAIMAILAHAFFELLNLWIVPKGLRIGNG